MPGEVGLREISEPACGAEEIKIEAKACAICMTDLRIMSGTYPRGKGRVPGREFSGIVTGT